MMMWWVVLLALLVGTVDAQKQIDPYCPATPCGGPPPPTGGGNACPITPTFMGYNHSTWATIAGDSAGDNTNPSLQDLLNDCADQICVGPECPKLQGELEYLTYGANGYNIPSEGVALKLGWQRFCSSPYIFPSNLIHLPVCSASSGYIFYGSPTTQYALGKQTTTWSAPLTNLSTATARWDSARAMCKTIIFMYTSKGTQGQSGPSCNTTDAFTWQTASADNVDACTYVSGNMVPYQTTWSIFMTQNVVAAWSGNADAKAWAEDSVMVQIGLQIQRFKCASARAQRASNTYTQPATSWVFPLLRLNGVNYAPGAKGPQLWLEPKYFTDMPCSTYLSGPCADETITPQKTMVKRIAAAIFYDGSPWSIVGLASHPAAWVQNFRVHIQGKRKIDMPAIKSIDSLQTVKVSAHGETKESTKGVTFPCHKNDDLLTCTDPTTGCTSGCIVYNPKTGSTSIYCPPPGAPESKCTSDIKCSSPSWASSSGECVLPLWEFEFDKNIKKGIVKFMDFDIPDTSTPARRLLEHHNLSASEYYAETTIAFAYTEAGESSAPLALGIIGTSLAGLILLGLAVAATSGAFAAQNAGAKIRMGTYTPVQLRTHYA